MTDLPELLIRARAFVDDDVLPVEKLFLAGDMPGVDREMVRLRARARELGLFAPHLPPSVGGVGLTLSQFGELAAVLGRSPLAHVACNCQAPDAGNAELMLIHGSPAQKARWLAPLAAGELRSCFGMTEPEFAGSNPTRLGTTAVLDGDEWVIDGHKWFTSSADGASLCIVMAVTDPEASRYARASMILVPTDAPGFEVVRNLPLMGEQGAGFASHAEVRLTGVRVPKDSLIGPRGGGFLLAQQRLGPGRIHHCMRWIGIAERALDLMIARAASRELDDGVPLATKQVVRAWMAESFAAIRASRLMVLDTARRIETRGDHGSRAEISAIKFYVADVMLTVLDRAIQTWGGAGMLDDEAPLAWWYRHERGARIYDGADEVHKMVVARELLKRAGVRR